MKGFKKIALAACSVASVFTLAACANAKKNISPVVDDPGKATLLASPEEPEYMSDYAAQDSSAYLAVKYGAEQFASKFAPLAYASADEGKNFTVSPISVYMALSLAAECAGGNTQSQLLNALGVSHSQLLQGFPYLYRVLDVDHKDYNGNITGRVTLGNSIWLDNRTRVKQDCLDILADDYFAYSYHADFANDNVEANKAVRHFVKQQTNGLIDQDFDLSEDTLITLINTMYLKDVWNRFGDELNYTSNSYQFKQSDSTVKSTKLLQGYYNIGRPHKGENYTTFFASTNSGYCIQFIVPDEGCAVGDVFTRSTLSEVNSITDYRGVDEVNKIKYHTRCLFPEYEAEYNGGIKDILFSDFGIVNFFIDGGCDFSGVTYDDVYCSNVQHVAKLKVDKKGVEGAAVTVIEMDGATAAPPEYKDEYIDFVIDKSFGFILTDYSGTTLFSGVVNKL